MRLTATKKVIATSAAALGVVLGAAGITAAATNPGTTPSQQQPATQGTGDYTPANEQGKPEPADNANEAPDTNEANDNAASGTAEGPEAPDPSGTDTKDTADARDATDQTPTTGATSTATQG